MKRRPRFSAGDKRRAGSRQFIFAQVRSECAENPGAEGLRTGDTPAKLRNLTGWATVKFCADEDIKAKQTLEGY